MQNSLPYELKRYRRAKYMRISVKPGGRVVVTVPWRVSQSAAVAFVQKQQAWIDRARAKMVQVPLPVGGSAAEYKKHKAEAHKVLTARLAELNAHYGFSYKRVSIRNQKTRWGSCSKSGTLSFNYKLLLVSPELRDYVLVHELCHTKEMNHSKKFWQLVGQACPNYAQLRAQLHKQAM